MWAIALTGTISALLALIQIGSYYAFNAIVSLTVSSYLSSYLIAILCMINKRISGEPIKFGPWRLGRWGLPLNILAAVYTTVTVVFSFFPVSVPVTAEGMNYSCVIFVGVILSGVVYYMVRGHKAYIGPSIERLGVDLDD